MTAIFKSTRGLENYGYQVSLVFIPENTIKTIIKSQISGQMSKYDMLENKLLI